MPRQEAVKGGEYEQLVDAFQEYDDKGNLVATYEKGDIVTLTAEQAERLVDCDRPSFAVPGTLAQAEADRLQAQADELKAQAEDAKSRAAEAAKAKASAKPSS